MSETEACPLSAGRGSGQTRRGGPVVGFGLVLGLVLGGVAASRGADPRSAVPAPPALAVQAVGFRGPGQILLLRGPDGTAPGRFADAGSVPVVNPVWVAGPSREPVAFVQGSVPRMDVEVHVRGQLESGTLVELRGEGRYAGQGFRTHPATVRARGVPDEVLRISAVLDGPLPQGVWNAVLELDWQVRVGLAGVTFQPIGRTDTRVLVTLGPPRGAALGSGGGVSLRRLDYLTALAQARRNELEVVDTLGPVLTRPGLYDLRVGSSDAANPLPPFAVLDGRRADCRTLSTLMVQALELLGVGGGRVMFVYPRTGTWNGLSRPDTGGSQTADIAVDSFGTRETGTLYFLDANGPNRYQACCLWEGLDPTTGRIVARWWMGGKGQAGGSDYDVLMAACGENRSRSARQVYVDPLTEQRERLNDGPVPFPDLPQVWGQPVEQARRLLADAGYAQVRIVYRSTWMPWMNGRARVCRPLRSLTAGPASPHEPVVIEVYRS